MRVAGAKEILAKRVVHVAAVVIKQRSEQEVSTVLNGGNGEENNSGESAGFTSHRILQTHPHCAPGRRVEFKLLIELSVVGYFPAGGQDEGVNAQAIGQGRSGIEFD